MPSRYNWLYVPFAYALILFPVLLVRWDGGVQPGELASALQPLETGTIQWLAKQTAFDATVVLVVTVISLGFLPPIRLRHVAFVASANVLVNLILASAYIAIYGTTVTNQGQVARTALSYGAVMLASVFYFRRQRRLTKRGIT